VSPDELNQHLRTVIVAPMTTGGRAYPWRPRCRFQGRSGFVALDQLRTVDVERLVKPLGQLDGATVLVVLAGLQDMFAE
jgi:mRNA interferase MazF